MSGLMTTSVDTLIEFFCVLDLLEDKQKLKLVVLMCGRFTLIQGPFSLILSVINA